MLCGGQFPLELTELPRLHMREGGIRVNKLRSILSCAHSRHYRFGGKDKTLPQALKLSPLLPKAAVLFVPRLSADRSSAKK